MTDSLTLGQVRPAPLAHSRRVRLTLPLPQRPIPHPEHTQLRLLGATEGTPFAREHMARSAHLLRGSGGSAEERNPLVGLLTSRVALCLVSILVTLAFTGRSIGPCGSGAASTSGTDIASFDLTPIQATAQGAAAGEKLLVLTPLKDAAPWLDEYFENLARLSYPRNLISLAFLVSDSSDNTVAKLRARARRLAKLPPDERYDSITILEKDFHFNLASVARHGFEGQPVRRNFIARARNYLLTAALRWDHAWVLWLDVDVVRYDPDILSDLQSIDKDIVVPNTLWHLPKTWDFWVRPLCATLPLGTRLTSPSCTQGFDRNNFAETEESLALLDKLGPDVMLVEGESPLRPSRAVPLAALTDLCPRPGEQATASL